ncbi:hypothetical protein NL676_015720 [Syzygium grande]|nr:hypothetical protein NL676_015720 [Syzygium grande]
MPSGDQPHGARSQKEHNEGEGSGPHLETREGSGRPLETRPSSGGGKIRYKWIPWSPDEDEKSADWSENHLNPTIEKGELSADEKNKIALLHAQMGNQWSYIAKQIKVYWNSSSRQRNAHPPAPLEGTSSATIIPQAISMLPSNQQTRESNHSIKGSSRGRRRSSFCLVKVWKKPSLPRRAVVSQVTNDSSFISNSIRRVNLCRCFLQTSKLEKAATPSKGSSRRRSSICILKVWEKPSLLKVATPSKGSSSGRSTSMSYLSSFYLFKVWRKSSLPRRLGEALTPESSHFIKEVIQWSEYELLEQFLPLQSLEEELTLQTGGGITSHQRRLIHIEQHPQGQSQSVLPSNQQTGESSHSIQGTEEEQFPPPRSLEEACITSHQQQLIHIEQHPQGQSLSALPSNQQTRESCHSIEGLIQGMEEEHVLLEQLPPPQSLVEALPPQAGGDITSHQRQLIHIKQHLQGPSASMLPSNQETGESKHSIIPSMVEEHVQLHVLLEQSPRPHSLEEALFPQVSGKITSH